MPKKFPSFSIPELHRLMEHIQNYSEFSLRILERWIPEISPQILRTMVEKAYKEFSPIIRTLPENQYLLELFHGPTASFKDFALQLFPQIFSYIASQNSTKYCILVSTSGTPIILLPW
jgi:threonine synthase